MVLQIRPLNEPIRLRSDSKLLRASEVGVWKEGDAALRTAQAYAERMEADARQAYEAQRALGYLDGLREAREAMSAELLKVENQTAVYFDRITDSVVLLVLDAVRKLVNGFDDEQKVEAVVHSCFHLMRTERHLRLFVHPGQQQFLRGRLDEIKATYPAMAHIELYPDDALARDACRVESEIGVAEASLNGQLEALLQALRQVFLPSGDAAAAPSPESVPDAAPGDDAPCS